MAIDRKMIQQTLTKTRFLLNGWILLNQQNKTVQRCPLLK
jgi:hypothetical protein